MQEAADPLFATFKKYDLNAKGYLSQYEVRQMMAALDYKVSVDYMAGLMNMFGDFDQDADGVVRHRRPRPQRPQCMSLCGYINRSHVAGTMRIDQRAKPCCSLDIQPLSSVSTRNTCGSQHVAVVIRRGSYL